MKEKEKRHCEGLLASNRVDHSCPNVNQGFNVSIENRLDHSFNFINSFGLRLSLSCVFAFCRGFLCVWQSMHLLQTLGIAFVSGPFVCLHPHCRCIASNHLMDMENGWVDVWITRLTSCCLQKNWDRWEGRICVLVECVLHAIFLAVICKKGERLGMLCPNECSHHPFKIFCWHCGHQSVSRSTAVMSDSLTQIESKRAADCLL